MSTYKRRFSDKVAHAVVGRDGAGSMDRPDGIEAETSATIMDRVPRLSDTKGLEMRSQVEARQDPTITASDISTTYTGPPPTLITLALTSDENPPITGALAANSPMETVVVSLEPPPKPPHHNNNGISQTTEHLLIAAGSIGATIILVMVIFAVYTVRKRAISFRMVIKKGRNDPRTPSRYGWENKLSFDDDYASTKKSIRSRTPPSSSSLQRSNSLNELELDRSAAHPDGLTRELSHARNSSAPPHSLVLPNNIPRHSASTHNTRSLDGNEPVLVYNDPPRPPPPSFRQFMSNRPSISQRPGLGGGTFASRFSWTNSQAPQTPHEIYADSASQPRGRDSYMTQASEAPRFRTIDSWVNQQSNRVDTDRLKQQFRMTQASVYSADDYGDGVSAMPAVPAVPTIPKTYAELATQQEEKSNHSRHESHVTSTTAPIFKYHPGNEVRFSTRSRVPSEVLDMGRKNAAL